MGKKSKKIKIPKNKDIEELVEKEENTEKIKTMKDAMTKIDEKKEGFKERISVEKQNEGKVENKKLQNVYARKDAQVAEQKRRIDLLKAISKIEEKDREEK